MILGSKVPSRSAKLALILAAAAVAMECGMLECRAQPMPLARRTGGILVSDLLTHQILLIRDLDGDGVVNPATPGEVTVFFDATNAAGLGGASPSFFSMFQTVDGTVYVGENSTRAVYALRDNNGNNSANDTGEARTWFSEGLNGNGFTLPTPNGISADSSGAIYILNSGTSSNPQDAIYRTVDTNSNGTADLPDESSIWADLSNLVAPTNISGAFDLAFIGNTAYFLDLRSTQTDVVSRAADSNNDGIIQSTEFSTFVSNGDVAGVVTVNTGTSSCITDGSSIYVHQASASTTHRLIRLSDTNDNHVIDTGAASTEAAEIWNSSFLPSGITMSNSFAIAVGKLGSSGKPEFMAMSSNSGTHTQDMVILLHDLNGDGDFMDTGETTILIQGAAAGFPDNIRQLLFYAGPCPADYNSSWSVSVQDIFDFLSGYFSNDARADFNHSGAVSVQDIFDFLSAYFSPC